MTILETVCLSSMTNVPLSRNTQPRKHLEIPSSAAYPGFHEIIACIHRPESMSNYLYGLFISKKGLNIFILHTVCISNSLLLLLKNLVKKEKYGSYEADTELPEQPQFGAVLEIWNYLLSKRVLLLYDTLNIPLRNPLIKEMFCFRVELDCGLNHHSC